MPSESPWGHAHHQNSPPQRQKTVFSAWEGSFDPNNEGKYEENGEKRAESGEQVEKNLIYCRF
jgi:hypothetical protein